MPGYAHQDIVFTVVSEMKLWPEFATTIIPGHVCIEFEYKIRLLMCLQSFKGGAIIRFDRGRGRRPHINVVPVGLHNGFNAHIEIPYFVVCIAQFVQIIYRWYIIHGMWIIIVLWGDFLHHNDKLTIVATWIGAFFGSCICSWVGSLAGSIAGLPFLSVGITVGGVIGAVYSGFQGAIYGQYFGERLFRKSNELSDFEIWAEMVVKLPSIAGATAGFTLGSLVGLCAVALVLQILRRFSVGTTCHFIVATLFTIFAGFLAKTGEGYGKNFF